MRVASTTRVVCEGCGHRFHAPRGAAWPVACPHCTADAAPPIWFRDNRPNLHAMHPTQTHAQWLVDEDNCLCVVAKECKVWIEIRPPYCDRGNYVANISATGSLARDLDDADAWPRYYFDLERAKLEIEAWLEKRRLT